MTEGAVTVSKWEWIAAAVSTALLIIVIATVAIHGRRTKTPPDLAVTIDQVMPVTAGYLATFTISNRGGQAAAQVVVEGTLTSRDGSDRSAETTEEKSETTFDYVPDGSHLQGGLMFTRNPGEGELTVRATGYRQP
jgi:uncharacterized protein (TIGR02588 family)